MAPLTVAGVRNAQPEGSQAFATWLAETAKARDRAGLTRRLRTRGPDDGLLDLASNDYLGLARNRRVIEAGIAALTTWGAGSTGSRLVTGNTELHQALENALAQHIGSQSALVFSSGYTANLAAVSALAGPDCLVVSDAANHASLVDGCRLSRSRIAVTPHADLQAVEKVLRDRSEPRAIVVTDSVCSIDGDLAPLAELHALARDYGAMLVIDEAHAIGVIGATGAGAAAAAGISNEPDVVLTVTLSKSLGSQGGAVLGSEHVIAHLVSTARSFIFDTGLTPSSVGAALAALTILVEEPERIRSLETRVHQIATLAGVPTPAGSVVSVILGTPERALAAQAVLRAHGVHVGCFRPPSVPTGTSRLRITARADLADTDLDVLAAALTAAMTAAMSGT